VKRAVLLLTLVGAAHADVSSEQLPQPPDILAKLIASAQTSGEPLASGVVENGSYYLQRAEYIGSCEAPFGQVHAAELFFLRSAPKGSSLPARGHTFVVFFDASLRPRARWDLDKPDFNFAFAHTKLLFRQNALFDFAEPPVRGTVIVDGKPQKIPQWTVIK
jgi:hypothetical protein